MDNKEPYQGRPFRSISYGQRKTAQMQGPPAPSRNASASVKSLRNSFESKSGADEDDSLLFGRPFGRKPRDEPPVLQAATSDRTSAQPQPMPVGPLKAEEEYRMNHKRRGKALIFNHYVFGGGESPRKGAGVDASALLGAFSRLGFEVVMKNNLRVREVMNTLYDVSREDHSDADCLVVVVMTHGDPGILQAYDGTYKEKELWKYLKASECPTLAGKPKLFFIQACRGEKVDQGVRLVATAMTMTDGPRATYVIPTMADMMVAYATFEGHYAWRNVESGSWFIQALCQELNANGSRYDILRLMTGVIRRVAIEYTSFVPGDASMHEKKQMSNFFSTLMRLVYFRPKAGPSVHLN